MTFETLWNALQSPAFLINDSDQIIAVNLAAEGFMNASAKSLIGVPCADRIILTPTMAQSFQRVRKNQSPLFINDVKIERAMIPDLLACNVQISQMSAQDTTILLIISPEQNLSGVNQNTAAKSAAKSAIGMAEMLAHEIKNPLAGITGAAQLLAMNLPVQDHEMTDLIVSEARRIVALLDRVEQFGNQSPPARLAVNIHDAIDRARKSAQLGLAANMQITQDYDPSLPDTWGDADQLIQVLSNLLTNAAQAAEVSGGKIRIRTSFDNSLRLRRLDGSEARLPIQIRIIDDGPGLPADIADAVFDPFVSGRENGTGLGLALVSKIISEHEGLITVESCPGRTEFRISLPAAPKQAGSKQRAPKHKGT